MPRTLTIRRPDHPLDAAAALFGSTASLARTMGYTPTSLYMMRARGHVSRRAALAIEAVTKGQITADEILAANQGE